MKNSLFSLDTLEELISSSRVSKENAYLAILGGSLKKMAKKITINVPVNKKTYTSASMSCPYYYYC